MDKIRMRSQQIAHENGLKVDSRTGTIFGVKNGYTVYLSPFKGTQQMEMSVSVCKGTSLPDSKELAGLVKQTKALVGCTVQRFKVSYRIRGAMRGQKTAEYVREALEIVTDYLRINGYMNCCQACGKVQPTEVYSVSGIKQELCDACFSDVSASADLAHQQQTQKTENVVGGIAGALIGSLLGMLAIVLIGQLGYVAALSGVVMGVCTLKGYELLGGRLSMRGLIISVVLMLVMVYMGNRVDWALTAARYFETDFWSAFQIIPLLIREQMIEPSNYYINLVLVYVFTALGAVPTVRNTLYSREQSNITAKMYTQDAYDL